MWSLPRQANRWRNNRDDGFRRRHSLGHGQSWARALGVALADGEVKRADMERGLTSAPGKSEKSPASRTAHVSGPPWRAIVVESECRRG
jgi:hypothetical protein